MQSVQHGTVSTQGRVLPVKLGGKSRAAGHFYLSNCNDEDFNNGAICTPLTIMKNVMLSASKAKLATLY
jgi:hypothetical protein